MAFALRYSVLPLISTVMQLAFDKGVEPPWHGGPYSDPYFYPEPFSPAHERDLQRSAINLQPFTHTKYFEAELRRHSQSRARTRKTPDS
jgi:hypothetical protein